MIDLTPFEKLVNNPSGSLWNSVVDTYRRYFGKRETDLEKEINASVAESFGSEATVTYNRGRDVTPIVVLYEHDGKQVEAAYFENPQTLFTEYSRFEFAVQKYNHMMRD